MSGPRLEQLPGWVADPVLAPLWTRLRSRLEANGLRATGRVTVEPTGRDERHALGALLGRTVTRDRLAVDLAVLDGRLRERSGVGGLVEVLTLLGGPLADRPAQRAARSAERELPLALARDSIDAPWVEEWVAGLRRTGLLTNRPDAVRVVTDALAVLTSLAQPAPAARSQSRVELAARLTGDAHALDEDRLLHQVVLRGLAAAAGVAVPVTGSDRRELWESIDVSPDLVSRTCLVWGLRPHGTVPAARRLRDAADVGDPVHVTAWDLRRVPSWRESTATTVLVCENPRVLEAVAEQGRSAWPVVCTAGEPNTVVAAVLGGLAESDVRLRYHGDFDWPGIAIANRIVDRFGAVPWRMSAADYEAAVRAEAPELAGAPVEPRWDAELGAAMRLHGRCVHEESVLGELIDALPPA